MSKTGKRSYAKIHTLHDTVMLTVDIYITVGAFWFVVTCSHGFLLEQIVKRHSCCCYLIPDSWFPALLIRFGVTSHVSVALVLIPIHYMGYNIFIWIALNLAFIKTVIHNHHKFQLTETVLLFLCVCLTASLFLCFLFPDGRCFMRMRLEDGSSWQWMWISHMAVRPPASRYQTSELMAQTPPNVSTYSVLSRCHI